MNTPVSSVKEAPDGTVVRAGRTSIPPTEGSAGVGPADFLTQTMTGDTFSAIIIPPIAVGLFAMGLYFLFQSSFAFGLSAVFWFAASCLSFISWASLTVQTARAFHLETELRRRAGRGR